MKVFYHNQFKKDLKKIQDDIILRRIFKFIEKVEQGSDLRSLSSIKVITGFSGFYRHKLGDYRIGFRKSKGGIIFDRVLQRKDIYKKYP